MSNNQIKDPIFQVSFELGKALAPHLEEELQGHELVCQAHYDVLSLTVVRESFHVSVDKDGIRLRALTLLQAIRHEDDLVDSPWETLDVVFTTYRPSPQQSTSVRTSYNNLDELLDFIVGVPVKGRPISGDRNEQQGQPVTA